MRLRMAETRYESFECAPGLRLEAHERLARLQVETLNARLDRVEGLIERLERRLWLTVFGIVGIILGQAFQGLLETLP